VVEHVLAWFLEEGFEVVLEERLLMDICDNLQAWPGHLHDGQLQEGTDHVTPCHVTTSCTVHMY
jgi:hypothetical protein